MASGGYRKPSNPAPVSGPGAQSRRTDGGPGQKARSMTGGEYGEAQEMQDLQRSAQMSQAPDTPQQSSGGAASPTPPRKPTPLGAPTDRPDEPLTAGSPFGAGAGPEALSGGLPGQGAINDNDARIIAEHLPSLLRMAEGDAPDGFKRFVRYLRDRA